MADGQGGKVRQDTHHLAVVLIECRGATVSHDEDGSPCFLHLPRKENAVGNERGVDPHDVEKALPDTKKLRFAALQADSACAGVARKDRVKKPVVLTGRCNPMVKSCVTFSFH